MEKGFTLIELLAVIVILAIIATIATPIILSIINDSRKNAAIRGAEYYLEGLEFSVANSSLNNEEIEDGTYNILENGNVCLEYNNSKCINILKVKVKGDKPSSGSVTITEGEVTDVSLNLNKKVIVKNNKGDLVIYTSPCKSITGDKNTLGSLYECEVKPGVKYNFYVLSQESDGTTNLIMDRNINSDGTPVTKAILESDKDSNDGIYNLVAWTNKDDYGTLWPYDNNICWTQNGCELNDKGPITAMKFLYNATKDWINIPELNYTYNDREYQGVTSEKSGYTSFVSSNGIATITSLSGTTNTIGTNDKPLRVRMPIYSVTYDEDWSIIEENGEVSNKKKDNSNEYLYYYLDNVSAYWSLSSYCEDPTLAWYVETDGIVNFDHGVSSANLVGVRPVINVQL